MEITTACSHNCANCRRHLATITSQDGMSRSGVMHSGKRLVRANDTLRGWVQDATEATLTEHEPAVRRLCIATAAGIPGLLTDIQQSEGLYRLYVMSDLAEGVELAFASPGLDEMAL